MLGSTVRGLPLHFSGEIGLTSFENKYDEQMTSGVNLSYTNREHNLDAEALPMSARIQW